MKTVLFIAPHLSTGGLPQYLFKKIESLIDTYKIYVIEYDDITGGVLVIQKNRIKSILGDNLITLPWGSDKQQVIDLINQINPDIIHLEEMPEYFMSDEIAKQIYTKDRKYKIFETCHDSSFNTDNKRFRPDKFILVSKYQVGMLRSLNVPSEVVEYPIEYKERPNRTDALAKLNLDPEYKHVLHVGLFTARKNQKEFFEYAKQFKNQKVIFHSVGNMADNFKWYWEPLLNDKTSNVFVHGEKSNVDDYYAAMDLFLFTSRGTVSDKETMPLVIREAISWQIPTLIYNLPVYENYFDDYRETVDYLDFDNFDGNTKLINQLLNGSKKTKNVVVMSCYPTTKSGIDLTKKAITTIKNQGYDIILTSHAVVPTELQDMVDYVVYDSNNILVYHDFYNYFWCELGKYRVDMNLSGEGNHIYHGSAVYTNYYNGISFAKSLCYDNAICMNFDMNLTDGSVITNIINSLNNKSGFFNIRKADEGMLLMTVLFGINIDFFLNHFKPVKNGNDYNDWKFHVGSESNGLENIFYHTLKKNLNEIECVNDVEYTDILKSCEIDQCSRVEYFTALSVANNPKSFGILLRVSNQIDDRDVNIDVIHNEKLIFHKELKIDGEITFVEILDYEGGEYIINLIDNNVIKKTITINEDYVANKLENNGKIKIK
jgi:hypothetical protein